MKTCGVDCRRNGMKHSAEVVSELTKTIFHYPRLSSFYKEFDRGVSNREVDD